jgi:branched-subunit amino acid ABC-type transport system permease component
VSTLIANGLVVGAVYGLVALGLSLTYKKSRVINFAYGETGMVGAFVFYGLYVERSVPYPLAMLAGVFTSTLVGAATFAVLRHRRQDPLAMLLGTLAVGALLIYAVSKVYDPNQHFVPPPLSGIHVTIFGAVLFGPRLLVLLVAGVLAALFFAVFRFTRVGLLFRASATDPYAAQLAGIDVVRLDLLTWAVAGALAGCAAILIAPLVGFDVYFMTLLSVRALAAALLAGLSNVAGTLLAGLAVGVAESGLTRMTTRPGVPEAVLVALMAVVLLTRPQGLQRATA